MGNNKRNVNVVLDTWEDNNNWTSGRKYGLFTVGKVKEMFNTLTDEQLLKAGLNGEDIVYAGVMERPEEQFKGKIQFLVKADDVDKIAQADFNGQPIGDADLNNFIDAEDIQTFKELFKNHFKHFVILDLN